MIFYFLFKDSMFLKLFAFYLSFFLMHVAHDGYFHRITGDAYIAVTLDALVHAFLIFSVIIFSRAFLKSLVYFSYDKILLNIFFVEKDDAMFHPKSVYLAFMFSL